MFAARTISLAVPVMLLISACGGEADTSAPRAIGNTEVQTTNDVTRPSGVSQTDGSMPSSDNSAIDEPSELPLVGALADLSPPFDSCPPDITAAIDTPGLYDAAADGTAASAKTLCLARTANLRVVVALNSAALNGAKTQSQQVANLNNIVTDYEKYGLTIGEDVEVAVVGYGAGARWLLNDSAYDTFFGTDAAVAEANPATAIVSALAAKGVKFFACQNTMSNTKAPGSTASIKTIDLAPEVNMVPAGVTALIDFQYLRYQYISP